jgi:hypothetical protein
MNALSDPRLLNGAQKIPRIRQIAGAEDQFEELADLLLLGNPAIVAAASSEDAQLPNMTPAQRVLSTLTCFNTQVLNGGLFAFLGNCPRCAPHVEPALRAIDFPELADAYSKAMTQLFNEGDPVIRQRQMQSLEVILEGSERHAFDWFDELYFGEFDESAGRKKMGLLDGFYAKSVDYVFANLSGFVRGS